MAKGSLTNVADGFNGEGISEARIDVLGAIGKIERVVQRLDFLLESVFGDVTNKMGWGGYYLVHFKEIMAEKSKVVSDYSEKERDDLLSLITNIVWKAWWEAEECYAFVYPNDDSYEVCPTILEAALARPVCSWNGPDISVMSVWVSDLAAIHDGVCSRKAGLGGFSKSAVLGFKIVIEDVRDRFKEIILELEQYVNNKDAA